MLITRIERLGRGALDAANTATQLCLMFLATLRGVVLGTRRKGEVVRQMYAIGNQSLVFLGVTMGFVGMVMVYQSCLQISKITGDLSRVGPEYFKLLVQDFGPTIGSVLLATRVGAGIAAEIGSMKVTDQVDALRMSGITPVDYLIVPRFLASIVMTVALAVFSVVVAFSAGGLTAYMSFNVNPNLFFDISHVKAIDLGIGLFKAVSYGMAIPVVSAFCGLRARGSSEGVGWATTAAVIGSSFSVIALGFLISGFSLVFLGDYLQ